MILFSQIKLNSYTAHECAEADAEVTLSITDEAAPVGESGISGSIIHQKTENGWYLETVLGRRAGLFINSDYTRLRLLHSPGETADAADELLVRVALECRLIMHGCVSLHSACVEHGGKAYAFTGVSGLGKSTRARAWMSAFEDSLISGDRPLVSVKNLEVSGVPWDGKEACFRNVTCPLECILEIRRSNTNYLRALSIKQKRLIIARQCFVPMWDSELAAVQMVNIMKLASKAKIYRAFCGREDKDAKQIYECLERGQILMEDKEMKAKEGFVLRNVVGEHILMPTGDNIGKFNGTVVLNELSAFIWDKLANPVSREDLINAILDEYEVEREVAAADLDILLGRFREFGVIED